MKNDLRWSFFQVWNKSLENRKDRPIKTRDNIWASEIGGAFIDRYLKMTGVEPTNPPDARALRKFEAGNLMEWVVELVLKRAGVFQDTQEWLSYQYPGLLEVTGKLDFLAGGKPDWDKASEEINKLNLPEFFSRATNAIIKHFADKYPDGLEPIVLEVKSCSSFMYEKYKKTGADPRHKMQTFHYLKAKGIAEGHIVYISKDDLRMLEFGVFLNSPLEEEYKSDIETMTKHIRSKTEPEKEKEIVYDKEANKFSANWKVGYSGYLKHLYGYDSQGDFDDSHKPRVARWNRVLTRIKDKKKMTKDNEAVLAEMAAEGFEFAEETKDEDN